MTAFGPYRETETIDFNELKDNKLFVISGNTGSGKTTIFDGICFALYGSASGEDRDNYAMLRSDFADDAVHTAVELEFALSDRHFRILRQLGHVKEGNKTRTGERYEFFEYINGEEVPAVDRQIVSEIDLKLESLIGLTQDQFKQIVMLPQGEFRKLLTSSTENKEAILRRLFKTEPYKHISEYMRGRKNSVEKRFAQEKQSMDHYIQNISSTLVSREESTLFKVLEEEYHNENQVMNALEEEINYYEEKIALDAGQFKEASKNYDKQQDSYHKAQALNERFNELESKENELKLLNSQTDTFEIKEKQVKSAQLASHITPYEIQYNEFEKEAVSKRIIMTETEKINKEAEELVTKQIVVYEQEEKKQTERENLSRELDRLKDFLPTVKDMDKQKNELEEIKKAGKKAVDDREKNAKQRVVQENEIEKEVKQINEIDCLISQLPEKERELNDMREQARVLRDYFNYKKIEDHLSKQIKSEKVIYENVKEVYLKSEKNWLNSQASILANHLHDGEACPVCGSEHHPDKAISDDTLITKEQLESLKKDFNKQDDVYRNLVAQKNTNDVQLKQAEDEVTSHHIELSEVITIQYELVEKGKRLSKEVKKLNALREEIVIRKEKHAKMLEQMKILEKTKDDIEQRYSEQKTLYETNSAVFNDRISKIPEQVRILAVLEERISETENMKQKLEKEWKDAQENLQMAKEKQTTAMANYSHASKQVEESDKKRDDAKERFRLNITKAGFATEEAYRSAKMDDDSLAKLTHTIDEYNQKKTTLFQQVSELNYRLRDNKKANLKQLQAELAESKLAYEAALKQFNQSKKLCEDAKRLKIQIEKAYKAVTEQQAQLSTISDLYDVIRGQNSKKISFERYLQIAYLEQIIDAANHRLETLSNGQFLLMRSDRQESHGRQSGLALDVYDGQTGQTRDVKTLSGGEKFNASLCLALGMSDIIQSFQGNISIKTMFIDEGFGSLDEESLHKSIDILIDLQESGRMIGVISHVEELKSIFPAVLEVKKSQEGHSQTRFVIK